MPPKAALIVAKAMVDKARERFSAFACAVRLTMAEGDCPRQTPAPVALPRESEIASRPRWAKHCDHFIVPSKAVLIVAEAMADRARERFSAPACDVRLITAEGATVGCAFQPPVPQLSPDAFDQKRP